MEITNTVQKRILAQLILSPALSFNQLWDKKDDSNKLAYHIQRLVSLGLIIKENNKYTLTPEGKALTSFLTQEGQNHIFPTIAYIAVLRQGKKLLCQERLKEPFRGYFGFVSGNLPFGIPFFDAIKKGIMQQTGLTVKGLQSKGFEEIITFEDNKPLHHHILYVVEGKAEGNLQQILGKKNVWVTKKEFETMKLFPKIAFDELIDPAVRFVVVSGQRFMKNGAFIGGKIIRKEVVQ